jgi:hypothetical protein
MKQMTNNLLINAYLNIIESHLMNSISSDNELKARKYSSLKRMAMQELKEHDNYINLVIHK